MADIIRAPHSPVRADAERQVDGELSRKSTEATAGGGLVRVRVDGHRTLRSLDISPEAFAGRDAALLADLIMSAISEAQRRLDDVG